MAVDRAVVHQLLDNARMSLKLALLTGLGLLIAVVGLQAFGLLATIDESSTQLGIAANVTAVADDTSASASEALRTARSLAATAADLRALVSVFTVDAPTLGPVPTPDSPADARAGARRPRLRI
jgi:xanthine/uracil/vitamin C permease (AzgA family)